MKKSRFFYWMIMVLLGAAAAAVFLMFPRMWYIWTIAGAAAAGVWTAYFRAIEYDLRGGILRISSGFLFKRERILPQKEILMTTRVALAGKLLFTVAAFSGGRVVLFAEYSAEKAPEKIRGFP